MDKFQYKRRGPTHFETLQTNKKFFRRNEHLAEFAKPNLPPGSASAAKQLFQAQGKEEDQRDTKNA